MPNSKSSSQLSKSAFNTILSVSIAMFIIGVVLLAAGNLLALGLLLPGLAGITYLANNRKHGSTQMVTDEEPETPLTVLQERYARGEINQAEFERRLDHLLETEMSEHATDSESAEPITEQL